MSSSRNFDNTEKTERCKCAAATDSGIVLVREGGIPFQPPRGNGDPFAEWLSLMEVVQMLCPVWPVRDRSMQGTNWKL